MDASDTVVLRPARGVVLAWTVIGATVVAGAAWILVDADGAFLAWLFLALTTVVTAYFALQLRPSWFHVRLDPQRLVAVTPWGRHDIPWDDVTLVRVIRVTGEPVLEVHVRDGAASPHAGQAVGILLPLGCDQAALHDFLEARLGRLPAST